MACHFLCPRYHPPAHFGQIRRSSARYREKSRHAFLSRQFSKRRSRRRRQKSANESHAPGPLSRRIRRRFDTHSWNFPGSAREPAGQWRKSEWRGGPRGQKQESGLNENYGREVMELHTVGVDGGYTQQDVIQMAECLTGWTIHEPRKDPEFFFDEKIHAEGKKVVLGRTFNYGGEKDGEEALKMLAASPKTANFISSELARHFVSDTPPPALVKRMAQSFASSSGDIRTVLKTMIYSPEFWSAQAYRAKVKT